MQIKAEAVSISLTAKINILICCLPFRNTGQNMVKMTVRKNYNMYFEQEHTKLRKKINLVTHTAVLESRKYHCATEVALFTQNVLLFK